MRRIKVKMIIEVPEGDYCWDFRPEGTKICEHLDLEGGWPKCDLRHTFIESNEIGYLKPESCRILEKEE